MRAFGSISLSNINDGNGIVSQQVAYAVSNSATTPPGTPRVVDGKAVVDTEGKPLTDGDWSSTIPSDIPQGYYLWTRTVTNYDSGDFLITYIITRQGQDGSAGDQGVSIVAEKEQWYLSDSSSTLSGGSWTNTEPSEVPNGKYLWGRWEFEMSDGSTQHSDAVYRKVISGVINMTDSVNKKITQKVWQSDINSSISSYDSSTAQSIRDRVTQTETTLGEIQTTISDIESEVDSKADGSTVTTLSSKVNTISDTVDSHTQSIGSMQTEIDKKADGSTVSGINTRLSTLEQTSEGFRQTVESSYARLTDVDEKIGNIKIGGHNLYLISQQEPGYLHSNGTGTISAQSSTWKEYTSEYIPVKEGENYIIQSWVTPNATGESWLAYQLFYADDQTLTDQNGNTYVDENNNTLIVTDYTPVGGRVAKYGKDTNSGVEVTADGQEHLTYSVKIPAGVNRIRVSYRAFEDGRCMVERATTPSEYAMNPKDIEIYTDNVVESAKSEIKQTTDNISLEVSRKVGTNEVISRINQSPENITISADKVDLVGHVTFSMLDSSAQQKITDAQDAADSANSALENIQIANIEVTYGTSSSATTQPTSWQSTVPAWSEGVYIWQKTVKTPTSGAAQTTIVCLTGQKGETGATGSSGVGIASTVIEYCVSASGTTPPGNPLTDDNNQPITDVLGQVLTDGSWTTTVPSVSSGQFLWSRTRTIFTNGDFAITYNVSRYGENGANGANGASITDTKQYYYLGGSTKPTTTPLNDSAHWSTVSQEYEAGKRYWTCNVTTLSNGSKVVSDVVELTGLTNANETALTANTNASAAVSTANAASTTANNALSQANSAVNTASKANDKSSVTLGMKVNYENFTTANNGECYIHGYTNGVAADVNGYVYWNDVKRNVTKTMINPNAVIPYYKTAFIVLRLSSASATSGTTYAVWYDGGWKYCSLPTPSSSAAWTWAEDKDVVLGQFIETGSEQPIIDAYLYNPPRNASHVTSTGSNAYGYSQAAVQWVSTNGVATTNATDMLKVWTGGAVSQTTQILGGWIKTHTITADQLATNAIMSNNYVAGGTNSPYSGRGTFLDLATGNIYMPNFGVNATTGAAYFNGEITAVSGQIGSNSTNYWSIGTFTDYDGNDSAGLIGNGTSYIQSGKWMISEDKIDTRWYDSQRKITYINNDNTFWDYGMQVPDPSSSLDYEKDFLYIRKHANTIPTVETDWEYPFRVTSDGKIYATDIIITGGGSGSTYLPLAGGTITGNLTVQGTLTATASKANQLTHSISVNGKSFDGSANVTVGTIGVGYGGTGATSFTSGTVLIGNGSGAIQTRAIRNNVGAGVLGWTNNNTDNTLITTNTLAYWNGAYANTSSNLEYVKLGKLGTVVTHDIEDFITTAGGVIDGSLSVTDLTAGNLVVTGAGRFTNGLYGDLTGNVVGNVSGSATKVLDSGNNKPTTFAYSKSGLAANWATTPWFAAWNGYELRSITVANMKTTLGLNNVDNTADANKSVAYATSAGSATKATQDGNGANIASTYLKLSGGTMTGQLRTAGADIVLATPNSSSNDSADIEWVYGNGNEKMRIWSPDSPTTKTGPNFRIYNSSGTSLYTGTLPLADGTGASGTWGINISGSAAKDGDGNTISSTYLKLSGGTLTGGITFNKVKNAINYTGSQNTYAMIKFIDNTNDVNGNGIAIGGAGLVVVGGGESSDKIVEYYGGYASSSTGGTEELALGSDGGIRFFTNVQKGTSTAFGAFWNTVGSLYPVTTNTGSLGNSSSKWADVYATTLHGNLDSRTFTIGNTGKSVDWSGNVSWSKAEISDNATTSAAGWMSAADKSKLDQINVSNITDVISASTIIGSNGISVTVSDAGVATIKHANSAITAGTASGTATSTLTNGGSFKIPSVTYDAYGHITATSTTTLTLPSITSVTGNAGTATKFASAQSVTLTGDTTGTASSQAGWSIATTTTQISTVGDKRAVATTPNDYKSKIIFQGLKTNSSFGSPSTDTYSYVVGLRGWQDSSGGNAHELAFNDSGIFRRQGATTEWGSWIKLIDSGNYTDYTVTKTGTGASGTWGINISGNAATASSSPILSYGSTLTTLAEIDAHGAPTGVNFRVAKVNKFTGHSGEGIENNDGLIMSLPWSNKWGHQLFFDDSGYSISHRYNSNGTWQAWKLLLDSNNYTNYTVTKTGSGASGTWGISISGNAATATSTGSLTGITANRFVIGNGTSAAYASSQMSYFNNEDLTVASTTVKRNGLFIWGGGYGNTASQLVSQTAGVLSWGDGGPQIVFSTSDNYNTGQSGALIFTDHDSCGTGSSFHFVSNQGDWNVNSKRFVAKSSVTVGANVPNTSYPLYVNGTSYVSGKLIATTGISVNNSSSDSGGINLYNTNNNYEYGIMFRTTSNQGKHGFVQADWGTYFTMGGSTSNVGTRGWVFKDHVNSKGVASISGAGNMALNGEIAIGTSGTNISGSCSLVMNHDLDCLDFVFN